MAKRSGKDHPADDKPIKISAVASLRAQGILNGSQPPGFREGLAMINHSMCDNKGREVAEALAQALEKAGGVRGQSIVITPGGESGASSGYTAIMVDEAVLARAQETARGEGRA